MPSAWRYAVKVALRKKGFRVIRTSDPLIRALDRIPTVDSQINPGSPEDFYLPKGYQSRTEPSYFNDTGQRDEYQKEVYEVARMYAIKHACKTVCDIGCGSAFKLVKNFGDFEQVIGEDVPQTVTFLRSRYPKFTWVTEDLARPSSIRADLVICSDVIEHVVNPNELLNYIKSIEPKLIVLSTPDRNLLLNGRHLGPPGNPCHIREWGFYDFHRYISDHLQVLEHFACNPFQATQMLIAKIR